MIGICDSCGLYFSRYGGPDVMNAPCRNCGSLIVWCINLGYNGKPTVWVKLDLRDTTKVLEEVIETPRYQEPEIFDPRIGKWVPFKLTLDK